MCQGATDLFQAMFKKVFFKCQRSSKWCLSSSEQYSPMGPETQQIRINRIKSFLKLAWIMCVQLCILLWKISPHLFKYESTNEWNKEYYAWVLHCQMTKVEGRQHCPLLSFPILSWLLTSDSSWAKNLVSSLQIIILFINCTYINLHHYHFYNILIIIIII